jgi:integrase
MARGSVGRRSGGWYFRVDVGVDPVSGARRQLFRQGFRSEIDARAAMQPFIDRRSEEFEVSGEAGCWVTVAEFLDSWLAGQRDRLRDSTWRSYQIAIARAAAGLGSTPLGLLSAIQIEEFYTVLSDRLSPRSVANTHVVLRKAFGDAMRADLIRWNPVDAVDPPLVVRAVPVTWTVEQTATFLESVEGHRLWAAFVVLARTGIRRGELLGLRWGDLDLDTAQATIVQTLTMVDGVVVFSTPLNPTRRRVVEFDGECCRVLERHRQHSTSEFRRADGLVFTSRAGRPVNPASFSSTFDRLTRRAGLPPIRLHDVRHTYATVALGNGTEPAVVSEQLGHSSVAITLDLYRDAIRDGLVGQR